MASGGLAPRWRTGLLTLALLALTLLALYPAIHGQYIWDDDDWLVRNAAVKSPTGLWAIWTDYQATPDPYPLVFTSFWLEHKLWGLDALGYHMINLLWHAGGALVLWRLLRRLGLQGAWLIAALWAIHPIQVESVAWVAERKNVMSGLFFFAALLAYVRFAGLGEVPAVPPRRWRWYGLSVALFIAALLSKSVTVTMPAVALLIVWWKSGRLRWKDLWPTLPLLALGLAAAGLKVYLEPGRVGAVGPEFEFSPVQRILIAGQAAWFYLGKQLWPQPLLMIYPKFDINPHHAWLFIWPLGVVAVLAALWFLRGRIGRGPLAAAAAFLIIVSPALGLISFYTMRYTFAQDHFQYVACAATFALLIEPLVLAARWLASRMDPGLVHRAACGLAGVVLVNLGVLTWGYAALYRWPESLWRYVAENNPEAWAAKSNLAYAIVVRQTLTGHTTRADLEEPLRLYTEVSRQVPLEWRGYFGMAMIHQQLGDKTLALQEFATADRLIARTARIQRAASHGDRLPLTIREQAYTSIHPAYRAALPLEEKGNLTAAMAGYCQAAQDDPSDVAAWFRAGQVAIRLQDYPAAVYALEHATQIKPDWAETWFCLAIARKALGRDAAAEAALAEAQRRDPTLLNRMMKGP